jgi:hypothetical protein
MILFFHISKQIINIENNIFSKKYDTSDNIPPIVKTFFLHFFSSINYKSKFDFFNTTINSIFIHKSKQQFIDIFCKIQKTYNSFRQFAHLYKYKKTKTAVCLDMALNEIKEYDKNILGIYHIQYKYLFRIQDLIHIINASLTNSYMFFAEPLQVKNPFNNLPFNKSTLYNIYFFIKFNTNIYAELVLKFFQSNFDLTFFLYNNENLLREYAINNYVTKSPANIIHKEILNMLKKYNCHYKNKNQHIIIDPEFPSDKLIKIMKPYLLLYFKITYSLVEPVKSQSQKELSYKLKNFQKTYPRFGKKIAVLKYNTNTAKKFGASSFITCYEFCDDHTHFSEENNFLTSHLSVDNVNFYYTNEDNIFLIENNNDNDFDSSSSDEENNTIIVINNPRFHHDIFENDNDEHNMNNIVVDDVHDDENDDESDDESDDEDDDEDDDEHDEHEVDSVS